MTVHFSSSAGKWGEVHYEHPTPEELDAAGNEIEAIRSLLSEARHRLFWLGLPHDPSQFTTQAVGFTSAASESLKHVEHALTPLIAYLYPYVQQMHEWAAHKRENMPMWLITEGHVVEAGWSQENRPGTKRGCIVRVPTRDEKLCGKQRPCPDHETS